MPIAQHPVVKSSQVIMQDLSSCLPLEFLSNALKLDVDFKKYKNKNKHITIAGLDATSSPGNKTL